jgi:predicted nucleic-acid-binding Zn-ribbon protein
VAQRRKTLARSALAETRAPRNKLHLEVQGAPRHASVGGITRTIGIMRTPLTCPKCAYRKFWILDQMSLLPRVQLAISETLAAKLGRPDRRFVRPYKIDGFEAMVCARCGYTEIYAADLTRVAQAGTFVDGDASG